MTVRSVGLPISRRDFLAAGGALIVSFALRPAPGRTQPAPGATKLPGSLDHTPQLDAWIRVDADGGVTVFTGKVELGQGIKTALIQIAAEQLGCEPARLRLITADTARTPDEGFTAGSHSLQDSGTAILNAAAQVREILLARAAQRLAIGVDRLKAENGAVLADDGRRVGFGELVAEDLTRVRAQPDSKLKDPRTYTVMGRPLPRVDIPAKVSGGVAYVQDLRLPGMVHARIIRPPSYGARLRAVASDGVQKLPGVLKVVRDGSYLAVIAEREYQAVVAMRALATAATWDEQPGLPAGAPIYEFLRRTPAREIVDLERRGEANPGVRALEASYRRPYQLHGAIGPSCAVGWLREGSLTVWTHSQGVYPLRRAIAEMLQLPLERVRCIHVEGAGCYGHNGADDAAADAALLARALPERPVRVQWMREQEHLWEPYGPAMLTEAKASLDAGGSIVSWDYHVWSNTHSTRPGTAGSLMPTWHLATPFTPPEPAPIPLPEGGGDRNAIPLYVLPNARVVQHFIPAMPLRVSALRALGAYMNIFTIESFIDELARAAGADPVAFRLRHLDDARAREVITTAATRFGWEGAARTRGRGKGFAFARYKNLGAYLALAVEVEVERETGRTRLARAVAAVDSGQAVNPDGLRNQIEGGIVQATSWTLHEAVSFNATRVTSADWSSYPILRFPEVPEQVEVHVINRPGQPFLGTGEAAQGPTAAALANAVADATGARLRELPLAPARVKAAIGV
jgi:nicotinate dehydrogenase subunit B